MVCSAHAEVILTVFMIAAMLLGLLRTRGGDPWKEVVMTDDDLSAPHTRR